MKHDLKTSLRRPRAQREPLPGRADMTLNHAGGYTFEITPAARLVRFLVLGTDGPTYYQSETERTVVETSFVADQARERGLEVVRTVLRVTRENRAPKAEPALLALAAVAKLGDLDARKAAWAALPRIARTGTHLLHFLGFLEAFGGWGRLTREGVARVYETMPLEKLALWAVKYRSRDGWSHADALRLAHPRTSDAARNALFRYIVDGALDEHAGEATEPALRLARGHALVQNASDDASAAAIMREYHLPIEAVPTHARGPQVHLAALDTNGAQWLLRNLGNLARHGVLAPGPWDATDRIVRRLRDHAALGRGRIHPVDVLKARLTYASGRGVRGTGRWPVEARVVEALEAAYHASFQHVEAAGKRFVLGIDVSGSMTVGDVAGVPGLTPNLAAAAMAMTTYRTEPRAHAHGFSSSFVDLRLAPQDNLDTVARKLRNARFGSTDCAVPVLWALENRVEADAFVIYTDNETWAGPVHPAAALREYRERTGIPARMIVVGLTATRFSIADPRDPGMLDVAGFDAAAPRLLTDFAAGRF